MPRGDGTGPNGAGSKTGQQKGFCSGNKTPGFESTNGRGFRVNTTRPYGQKNTKSKGIFSRLNLQNRKRK